MNHWHGLALLTGALIAAPALAWNARGHAAVAALAESQLGADARAQVAAVLADDLDRFGQPSGRRSLAAVASWPDEIRAEATRTDPEAFRGWHVRGNPVCSDRLGRCPQGHCVDQLILSYSAVLRDRAVAVDDGRISLGIFPTGSTPFRVAGALYIQV